VCENKKKPKGERRAHTHRMEIKINKMLADAPLLAEGIIETKVTKFLGG
jgi:hypothetical protein